MEKVWRYCTFVPLYDALNSKIQSFGILHSQLSIDESMVPYFGKHSCKRGKPIRFGYKCWTLASATGVPYNVSIYEGKTEKSNDDPLGTRVVKSVLEVCKEPKKHVLIIFLLHTNWSIN